MKSLKVITLAFAVALPLLAISLPSQAAMTPYIETALIDVCKAAKTNQVHRFNKTMKSYNLKDKTVALKVMCNGSDIISYAERNGATETAAKLQESIGNVQITDMAALSKINVTFKE